MFHGSAEGLILKIVTYGEADLLVWVLTPEFGPLRVLARKGLRSVKRFGGRIFLFNRLEFDYSRRRDDEIAFIESARLVEIFPGVFTDEVRFGRAALFAEVLLAAWGEGDPAPEACGFYLEFLRKLERGVQSADRFVLDAFRLLEILGHRPVLDRCASCEKPLDGSKMYSVNEGGAVCENCAKDEKIKMTGRGGTLPFAVTAAVRKTVEKSYNTDPGHLDRLKFSAKARVEAFDLWIEHIKALLGRTPKCIRYLSEFERTSKRK